MLKESIAALRQILKNEAPDYKTFEESVKFRLALYQESYNEGSLFRATTLGQEELNRKINKSRFSYKKQGVKFGRANIDDFPVFYGSNTIAGAVDEVIRTKELKPTDFPKRVFVSEWVCQKTHVIKQDMRSGMPLGIKGFTPEQVKDCSIYLKLLGECYLHTSKKAYDFTSKYSHSLLYENRGGINYNIIIYPSVASDRASINYALHPDLVKHYALQNVWDLSLVGTFKDKNWTVLKLVTNQRIGKPNPDPSIEELVITDYTSEDLEYLEKIASRRI